MKRSEILKDWYDGMPTKEISKKYEISEFTMYTQFPNDERRKLGIAKRKGSVCPICGAVILLSKRLRYCSPKCKTEGLKETREVSYETLRERYDLLAQWRGITGRMKGLTGNLGYASYASMRFQMCRFAKANKLPWPPSVDGLD